MFHAFLNLNKPAGITAHDCVSRVRKLVHQKRVGHSGTLDPSATGVLPIALGQTTRLLRFLPEGKAYKATVRFGIVTNTDDLDGEVLRSQPCPELHQADIEALLPLFQGMIQQRPPAFSAIHVDGKRLYDLARSGQVVEAPLRTVEIKEIQILAWRDGSFPELKLMITCGTGTYIRSIARDLGEKLGCGATLAGLERTYSNGFTLNQSLTLEHVASSLQAENLVLTPPEVALAHLPEIYLEADSAKRWCFGQVIAPDWETAAVNDITDGANFRVMHSDRHFLGIGEKQQQSLHPIVVMTADAKG